MKLLLISNSTNPGEAYLGWPRPFISDFLKLHDIKNVLFIPYAGVTINWDEYEQRVADVYAELGAKITSIHKEKDAIAAIKNAESIAVGGGNTFNLLYWLHLNNLVPAIAEQVKKGTPYMGWSAGSNVACPTLRTTNDMPIIQPASFDCCNLIPFQINPHYLDTNPEGHGGETRQQRIEEYITLNKDSTVVGLRESSLIEVNGNKIELKGYKPMRLFRYGKEFTEIEQGSDLGFLMK